MVQPHHFLRVKTARLKERNSYPNLCYCFTKLMGAIGSIPFVRVAIWISMAKTSWRSESSNISLVILDKLLFGFQLPYPLEEGNQAI